ncbi:piggyBac transposable element-derived protein 4-like [Anastrepha ludens]|uniref:piggyBac transposable element-derived protein 4-like n=1 Tax=Anastrepha ludens TaxID=28586 RepID=UPI0023B101B4|nr:piggyBac transposable element-derived protein 4-like [Anastrepha ludens]
MANQQSLTDKQIEKFLSCCDSNDEFESDDSEIGCDTEVEEEDFVANTSSSDEATDEDEDNVITCEKTILRGKNGHKWSSVKGTTHHYGLNIVHKSRGPTRQCKNIIDPIDCFKLFITGDIVDEVVKWTNVEINQRQSILLANTDQTQRRNTNANEIYAVMGILVLTAVKKDQHLSVEELFDRCYSGSIYASVLTKARFQFLMSCLRFDDKSLRLQLVGDEFAPIRKIWEIFVKKCRENYSPGPYLTVDEQLLAFRGKCSFKMYIPNKPAKYGIKMVMLCDSGTKYMVDAIPYLGKHSNNTTMPLGEFYVKELTKTVNSPVALSLTANLAARHSAAISIGDKLSILSSAAVGVDLNTPVVLRAPKR